MSKCSHQVGNGLKTSFWLDGWLGVPLKQLFPLIFSLNQQQDATVGEVWDAYGWNLNFRRHLNDWEIDNLAEFYDTLNLFKGPSSQEDTLTWQVDKQRRFSIRSAYKELNYSNNQISCWPWKLIWKVKIPYKVACFSWVVARKAVLTHEVLKKRGFHLCSKCYMCEEESETIIHLFLHCKLTVQLWRIFLNLKGIMWVMPRDTVEVLECWNKYSTHSEHKERWKIVPACIWWTVWKERNQRCFEDNYSSTQKLKMKCLALFYFWCKHEYMEDAESFVDVIGSLK
ncbi:hypothetical protein P3L10_005691 [Capsicum annuum]